MSKFLSIVIPYYKETEQTVLPLLSSINNQVGIDFKEIEVILVNDGVQNGFPSSFLELFHNLEIRTILMPENRGPGVARQVGLDAALGEYVMFCDADDILHSVAVMGAFVQEIRNGVPDVLISPWIEELLDKNTGQNIYVTHDDEATWMHGKVFRTEFLRRNTICFHPDLRVHEDSYFLSLVFEYATDVRKVLITSYVWRWSENSITRQNEGVYTYESFPVFHQAVGLSMKELERRGMVDKLVFKVAQLLLYTYFVLHQDNWLEAVNLKYRMQAETSIVNTLTPFLSYYKKASTDMISQIYNDERSRNFANGIEVETYVNWLKRIGLWEKLQ